MKKLVMALAAIGVVILMASASTGLLPCALFASWGGASSSSGCYPASSSSSGTILCAGILLVDAEE